MASFYSNCHVRSASLPCASHPTTLFVEEELNKLKTWESSSPTAEKICSSLSGLEELYRSVSNLLTLSATQQAFAQHQNEKWAGELLDGSVRLLDACGRTRDLISELKENVAEVQSTIRRRKGDLSIGSSISKYVSFTKRMKRDAKKLISDLKQIDNQIGGLPLLDVGHHLLSVITVIRKVSSLSMSTFQSVLTFSALPILVSSPKSRWPLISKLMQKRTEKVETTNDLEALDASLQSIDCGLESMFRRLIATRASLLNILSC